MTAISDLLSAEFIQRRRIKRYAGHTGCISVEDLAPQDDLVRNINVRVFITLIAQLEVLAEMLGLSKSHLVSEILEGGIEEACSMMKQEDGYYEEFEKRCHERLQLHYGVKLA